MANLENLLVLNELLNYLGESESDDDFDDHDNLDIEVVNYIANNNDNEPKCYCIDCRPRITRIQNFILSVVDEYSDIQFQKNFR